METFEELRGRLSLTRENRLILDTVHMLLMPRWFFVAIKKQVEALAGPDIARKVYYEAGYEGATLWAQRQMKEAGLTGRAVMEQYLRSGSLRGWGHLEIVNFEIDKGTGFFRLHNSAVAEETGSGRGMVCDHLPGSLAGAFQAILDHERRGIRVVGRETKCMSNGDLWCEFVVEPEGKATGV
jgi:predicted hydrocarbon binding protein